MLDVLGNLSVRSCKLSFVRDTFALLGIRWAFVGYTQHSLDGRYACAVILYYVLVKRSGFVPHSLGIRLIRQE